MARKSILAHTNLREIFDRALDSAHGISVATKDHGAGVNLRQQLYSFRAADRTASVKIYEDPDDPKHGTSVYDPLIITVKENSIEITLGTVPEINEL